MLGRVGSLGAKFDSTTHPGAPVSTAAPLSLQLVLVYPPEVAGTTTALTPGLILGRSQDAIGMPIMHGTVSRRHAVVERKFGAVLCLRDLDSRNGTRVNGRRLSTHAIPLAPQSVVRLGDVLGVVVDEVDEHFCDNDVLPGRSSRMAAARATLARAAADSAPLLVSGETGTGKERVAKEVHRRSARPGPLLALNCAELASQLVETQLFGHERGAFTGAVAAKSGLFLAAHQGTLFLDEVGELPLELQPKLLRVLQEGEVRPVGSVKSLAVNVRVVAATNRDLWHMAERGTFRRDLLARLSVWELALPPVRERREDLFEWLTLLQRGSPSAQRSFVPPGTDALLQFAPNVAEHLLLHPWPDNLRGLDRLVHRLSAAGVEGPVGWRQASSLMPELFKPSAEGDETTVDETRDTDTDKLTPRLASDQADDDLDAPPRRPAKRKPSREELLAVYEAHGRSIRATSRHFGKDRRQIYRWFDAYQLPREPNDD